MRSYLFPEVVSELSYNRVNQLVNKPVFGVPKSYTSTSPWSFLKGDFRES